MKLLQVALAGLVGLAGFAAAAKAEARGEVMTSWDNDASGKYICTGTNIEHCSPAGTDCAGVESCPDGCFDTGNGAVCIYRAHGEARAADEATLQEKYDFNNYGTTVYKCRVKLILECSLQREDTPRCGPKVASCKHGCEEFDTGASCRQISQSESRRAESTLDAAEKETYECSNDHRGRMSCNYGFCAVKPGDWCWKGYSCRDDCACCKKDGGKTVVADAPIPPEIDRGSEAPCTPRYYDCHPGSNDWLRVCNAQGEWDLSAFCGSDKGYTCCKGPDGAVSSPNHRCDCRDQSARLIASPKVSTPREYADTTTTTVTMREDPKDKQYCYWPGHYGCLNGDLYVCDAHNMWVLSAKCGKSSKGEDCCKIGPEIGVAHCVCPAAESSNLLEDRSMADIEASAIGTVAADLPCGVVGLHWCDEIAFKGLYVCGQNLQWQLVADCGTTSTGFGCCRAVLPGSAWCDCRGLPGGPPMFLPAGVSAAAAAVAVDAGTTETTVPTTKDIASREAPSSVAPDSVTPESSNEKCTPGQFWCETPGWDWVIVCNLNGDWERSNFCGKTSENYGW
ncbi:hypothetical protein HBI25_037480 [Parastagonospora nodorum]|nr:hypothetical protein HBI09_062230 [Parastagonospora nodorum]KAH4054343.1 hypothetical protein HBH49_079020 [Parastagonospora nodorum]KAH4174526.1 hypothetical protein HBH43_077440 [Parastagonospora nodorum]KAH4192824.1 hypothetical protein HBH42_112050 [Parastagonospora nodorum]KAH4210861.1 hypothetical protein HBI95_065440 [Parastagonospora nodorum]